MTTESIAITEEWRPVEGYSNFLVSSLGQVKNIKTNKILKLSKYNNYLFTKIPNENTRKKFRVHRLVALAFIPNPENKPAVNHINGIKSDNRLENLEWVTTSENHLHAYRIGLKRANVKLKKTDVDAIRIIGRSMPLQKVAEMFNTTRTTIYSILIGKTWSSHKNTPNFTKPE